MARIWFVTGSSRGLGLAIVEAVLESGDTVVATARDPAKLSHLVEKYGSDKVLTIALDVVNNDQVLAAVNQTVEKFGRIDVVVNNAGYANCVSIEDSSLDMFRNQFDTNFFGVVNVTKAVLPILREQKSGRILQVSSVGSRLGSPGLGSYQSAKWAVSGFSTVLNTEVASFGIKVTVLEPGGMKTNWAGDSMGEPIISEPYKPTVGWFHGMREGVLKNSTEPADVAKTIVKVSQIDDPPLRLLLGPDTIEYAKQSAENLARSDETWKKATLLQL